MDVWDDHLKTNCKVCLATITTKLDQRGNLLIETNNLFYIWSQFFGNWIHLHIRTEIIEWETILYQTP